MLILYAFTLFLLAFDEHRWGIVHTDKFWRENAKFVEHDDFAMLKQLIALLESQDPVRYRYPNHNLFPFLHQSHEHTP